MTKSKDDIGCNMAALFLMFILRVPGHIAVLLIFIVVLLYVLSVYLQNGQRNSEVTYHKGRTIQEASTN